MVSSFRVLDQSAFSTAIPDSTPPWDWTTLRQTAVRQARRYLDHQSAEDAAQEAVLRAWRYSHTCSAQDPTPWVATIARREALRLAGDGGLAEILDDACLPQHALGPDQHQHDVLQRDEIQRALLGLSIPEREALLLHYWADLTYQQIANALSTSTTTIKLRVFRARHKLSSNLAPDLTSSP